jgi:L-alanine-DL-glutamate epimerase-like enolase superfamily enzyme
MKITGIETFYCDLRRKGYELNPILIRVNTDEGISGIGEVGLAYGAGGRAGLAMIRDISAHVIGADPTRNECLWERLFRNTFWGLGGGPVVYGAMSAIDIACWDIRGKALNAPVHLLLGGKSNGPLRAYASQLQFGWGPDITFLSAPEQYAEAARKAISEGYGCVKVNPLMMDANGQMAKRFPDLSSYGGILTHDIISMGRNRLAAIRDAVGPDVDIILELHSMLGVSALIQFVRAVEDIGIFFCEEPVGPLNTDNARLSARSLGIPLAAGERSYTRWGFRDLLEKQAVAVVQPDLCLCGGITEGKKISDFANIYDVTVQVHACGSPVTSVAALHLEAVIPNFIIHEHHVHALCPHVKELCVHDYAPTGGRLEVPDLPGLGQELNDEVVMKYDHAVIS